MEGSWSFSICFFSFCCPNCSNGHSYGFRGFSTSQGSFQTIYAARHRSSIQRCHWNCYLLSNSFNYWSSKSRDNTNNLQFRVYSRRRCFNRPRSRISRRIALKFNRRQSGRNHSSSRCSVRVLCFSNGNRRLRTDSGCGRRVILWQLHNAIRNGTSIKRSRDNLLADSSLLGQLDSVSQSSVSKQTLSHFRNQS